MVTPDRLTDMMQYWFEGSFARRHGISFGPNGLWDLGREGNRILITSPGYSQIVGFDSSLAFEKDAYIKERDSRRKKDRNIVPSLAFFALNINLGVPLRQSIAHSLEEEGESYRSGELSFLNHADCEGILTSAFNRELKSTLKGSKDKGRASYRATFFDPGVYFGSVNHLKRHYGVLVRAPIINLPVGEAGHISENLFNYARTFIIAPLSRSVSGK